MEGPGTAAQSGLKEDEEEEQEVEEEEEEQEEAPASGGPPPPAAEREEEEEEEEGGEEGDGKRKRRSGGSRRTVTHYSSAEEEVAAIQRRREAESRRGTIRPDEAEGEDDDSDPGTVYSAVERDFGDWGVYTPTGAQLSSSEVQGVLLLSDVYGPFTDDTRALADKIAFECQPAVVLAPDMFRGDPWTPTADDPVVVDGEDDDGVERDRAGRTYEEWRASHPGRRVDVDVRAAAAVLRERYAVSSVAVWGTCYGGGRALEAASGWYEGGKESYLEDVVASGDDGRSSFAPPHVDPVACVAWYPTRYDARRLFGADHEGFRTFEGGADRSVAVMAVFGGDDALPGATPEDAALLRECLDEDPRIKDCMVKVFPGQGHGFAHANLGSEGNGQDGDDAKRFMGDNFGVLDPSADNGGGDGDAEVACLLSTAWMETYTRVFLPTVGTPVRLDADSRWAGLEMGERPEDGEVVAQGQGLRAELEEAIAKHDDVDIDMGRMSRSSSPLMDGPGSAEYDRIEEERERIRLAVLEEYDISEEDDEESFDRKFEQARKDGALDRLMLDAYMDESNGAYW